MDSIASNRRCSRALPKRPREWWSCVNSIVNDNKMATVSRLSNSVLRQAYAANTKGVRLGENYPKELVDDIFASALKKQTGVSLKYMCVSFLYLVVYGFCY